MQLGDRRNSLRTMQPLELDFNKPGISYSRPTNDGGNRERPPTTLAEVLKDIDDPGCKEATTGRQQGDRLIQTG